MAEANGWVSLAGRIVTVGHHWETVYNWDRRFHRTREWAITAGLREYGSDDFNVGQVVDGTLVWFGWMDEQHPVEDYASVAEQFGWAS